MLQGAGGSITPTSEGVGGVPFFVCLSSMSMATSSRLIWRSRSTSSDSDGTSCLCSASHEHIKSRANKHSLGRHDATAKSPSRRVAWSSAHRTSPLQGSAGQNDGRRRAWAQSSVLFSSSARRGQQGPTRQTATPADLSLHQVCKLNLHKLVDFLSTKKHPWPDSCQCRSVSPALRDGRLAVIRGFSVPTHSPRCGQKCPCSSRLDASLCARQVSRGEQSTQPRATLP